VAGAQSLIAAALARAAAVSGSGAVIAASASTPTSIASFTPRNPAARKIAASRRGGCDA